MRTWDSAVRHFGQDSKNELAIPNHSSMQATALHMYLKKHYDILTNCDLSSSFNILQASLEIKNIFLDLYNPLISSRDNPWTATKLDEVLATYTKIT